VRPFRTFAATLAATGAMLAPLTAVAPASHAATTLTFYATEITADADPAPAFSVGTVEAFSETLTDTSGRAVGVDTFHCVVTRVLNATTQAGVLDCKGTAQLKDGTLVMQGPVSQDNTDTRLAVVGGTGAYAAATGSVLISAPDAETTQLTIVLR
jgi:hypothetical protein